LKKVLPDLAAVEHSGEMTALVKSPQESVDRPPRETMEQWKERYFSAFRKNFRKLSRSHWHSIRIGQPAFLSIDLDQCKPGLRALCSGSFPQTSTGGQNVCRTERYEAFFEADFMPLIRHEQTQGAEERSAYADELPR
jgi:hypothetical protein